MEYEHSIIQMLFNQEKMGNKQLSCAGTPVSTRYLTSQRIVTSDRDRATLLDRIVRMHRKISEQIGLRQETLHIAVTIIDRILWLNSTPPQQLLLLGLASLMIATKFEDVIQPTSEHLCRQAANDFGEIVHPTQIKNLEKFILEVLNFDVQYPTTNTFNEMFCNLIMASQKHKIYSQFLIEIVLLEARMMRTIKASLMALAAVYLAS